MKADESQVFTRTSRPTVNVKKQKPESLPSETGVNNHYRTAGLQISNAEETVKLTPPLNSTALKYVVIPINSVDAERSFSTHMGTLCHPNDAPDSNSQQPPLTLIKVCSEFEKKKDLLYVKTFCTVEI